MLRNRIRYEFVRPEQVLTLSRDGLAASGLAVATITARAVDPGPTGLAGVVVTLDGDAPQDRTPACDMTEDPLCAGASVFNFYTVEAVQRIGYDSFTPDNGVLIAKNKNAEGNSCGYNCFTWVIDAHPEDINQVDFKRPDGAPVMRTVADYRQLNDALFHAGAGSGSQSEWEDTPNRLHFYVIDVKKDANGILSYTVGVRSLDGAGRQSRGVTLAAPAPAIARVGDAPGRFDFTLKNTGAPAPAGSGPWPHPRDVSAYVNADIYRLTATVDRHDWSVQLPNALAAVRFGEPAPVRVLVSPTALRAGTAKVTVKAVSESDPTKTAIATLTVSAR